MTPKRKKKIYSTFSTFSRKKYQQVFKLFCYSTFSNKFSISTKQANPKETLEEHILELPINYTPSICQYVPKIMVFEWIADYQKKEPNQMDPGSLVPKLMEISTSPSFTLTTSAALIDPLG